MPALTPHLLHETVKPPEKRTRLAAGTSTGPAPSVLTLFVGVALAAYANFNVIWNHFFHGAPQLFDTGWYAHLVHRSTSLLANPPTVAFQTINHEFYSTHYSPLLWLLALPTYVLPIGPQVWLACLEALKHAWIAGLAWTCVRAAWPAVTSPMATRKRAPDTRWLARLVIVLAPFTGVLLACIAYPHFETWFIPLALTFFWLLLRGRTLLATPFFIAALMVREDVGFHLCGLLVVCAGVAWWRQGRWQRDMTRWLGFAVAGFAWSCTAVLLMKALFPGDDAFNRVYLGDPPFAHLTWAWLTHIVSVHLEQRGYIWMPLLVYAIWAVKSRAWWVLIGYVAFLPWFAFNFLAVSINPATLSLYYAYPFAFALLWPLVGRLVFERPGHHATSLVWMMAAFAVSIFGYARGDDNPWRGLARDMLFPQLGTKSVREAVVTKLAEARREGTSLSVDGAIAGLAPAGFDTRNLFGQSPPGIELAGFFTNGRSRKIAWETTRSLPFHYEVVGTPIVVVSARTLDWPHLELISAEAGSILPFLENPASRLAWKKIPGATADDSRIVCEGPDHWYIWSGETWKAIVTLSVEPVAEDLRDQPLVIDILAHGPSTTTVVGSATVPLPSGAAGDRIQITRTLEFLVPGEEGSDIAVRVRAPSRSAGQVKDVVLRPVKTHPRDAAGQPIR